MWLEDRFVLLVSPFQLNELDRVLGYVRNRDRCDRSQIDLFLENLPVRAELVYASSARQALSPDPDDTPILAAAIAGRADLIVSGDKKHMLSLGQVEGIPIVTPAEALHRLHAL